MSIYEKAREKRRGSIRQAFLKAYQEQPIHKITVSQICQACQMNRSTFYRYYPDVYAILEEIESEFLEPIRSLDLQEAESMAALYEIGKFVFENIRENFAVISLFMRKADSRFARLYQEKLEETLVGIIQTESENTHLQDRVKKLTAHLMAETFLQLALQEEIEFTDTFLLIQCFLKEGYFITLKEHFKLKNLIEPK